MKHLLTILFSFLAVYGCCQTPDHDFKVPIKVISIQYPDGTIQTTAGGTGIVDWASVTNKPATFSPSVHSHDALYKPINYVPSWTEITGKPAEIDLNDAILQLGYLPIPEKTTAEINALVITGAGIVFDKTLGVYKIHKPSGWVIMITNN